MSNIILQPCGSNVARKHFTDTIDNPVSLSSIGHLISPTDLHNLRQKYPEGSVPVWGVTPGGNNFSKWSRVGVGDVALFSWLGYVFASAVVTYKLQNKKLAEQLWGYDDKNQTWEYIYFLDELKEQHISYKEFNQVANYNENYVIQGFNVLSHEKSNKIIRAFDLESPQYIEEITAREFDRVLAKLDELEETDQKIRAGKRLEQGYLKRLLFGERARGICGICNKEYPVSFLVTAHIKKRAYCDLPEKKDHRIVMPMCKFGCDELFENGYISVSEGVIVDLQKSPDSTSLARYKNSIVGQSCSYYNNDTKKYFDWHLAHHRSKSNNNSLLSQFVKNR